jgi:hypothetical protein
MAARTEQSMRDSEHIQQTRLGLLERRNAKIQRFCRTRRPRSDALPKLVNAVDNHSDR